MYANIMKGCAPKKKAMKAVPPKGKEMPDGSDVEKPMEDEEVKKFNQNHGKGGLFASSGGGHSNSVYSSGQKTPHNGSPVIQHSVASLPKPKKRKRTKRPSEYGPGEGPKGKVWTPGTDHRAGVQKSDRLIMAGSMEAGMGLAT